MTSVAFHPPSSSISTPLPQRSDTKPPREFQHPHPHPRPPISHATMSSAASESFGQGPRLDLATEIKVVSPSVSLLSLRTCPAPG